MIPVNVPEVLMMGHDSLGGHADALVHPKPVLCHGRDMSMLRTGIANGDPH